jgi:spore coat polysaccharide biosynthesis protein SpsF
MTLSTPRGKVGLIVQARMTSSRLPGKVAKLVCGRSLVAILLERLRHVRGADETVLAIPDNAASDPLVTIAEACAVPVVRGSEDDVLARFVAAAHARGIEHIVRITSDCPCLDPRIVDELIEMYLYVS